MANSLFILCLIISVWDNQGTRAFTIVTGSFGMLWMSLGIYETPMTRYEAAQACLDNGFDHLDDGELEYIHYLAIKQKLQEDTFARFDGSNTTFWVDFFRLQDTSHAWYRTSLCEDATDSLTFAANAVDAGDNCVAVHFSYNFENKFHWAVDCSKRLPFICVKTQIDLPDFMSYSGFVLGYIPEDCTTTVYDSASKDYTLCVDLCKSMYDCVGLTYTHIKGGTCELLKIGLTAAWVTYSLETDSSQYIHAVKNGTIVEFKQASVPLVTDSFPCPSAVTMGFDGSFIPSSTQEVTTAIPSTSSDITMTVTAYTCLPLPPVIDIYEDEVTWFDAQQSCTANNTRLDITGGTYGFRMTLIKQALRDKNISEITLWAGYFKPLDDWYDTNADASMCSLQPTLNITTSGTTDQCSVWKINDTSASSSDPYMAANNCDSTYPYYCIKWPGSRLKKDFVENAGWTYASIPTNLDLRVYNDVNRTDCVEPCIANGMCIGWSFWHIDGICHRLLAKKGYAYITYNITTTEDNVTHGYQENNWVTVYPKTSSDSLLNYPQLFPCNLTSSALSSLPSSASTTASGQPSSTSTSTSSHISSTTDSNYESSTSTPASSHSHSTSTIASTTSSLGTTTTSRHWTLVSKTTTSLLSSTSTTTSGYPSSTATSISHHISTATNSGHKMPTSTTTTGLSSSTRSVGYTSLSTTTGSYCRTSCPCQYSHKYNTTELELAIESIIQNLTINKAETSKAKRQLTSAEDTRTSAQVVGGLGAAFLSVVFGGILLCDLPRLFALGTKG